MPYLCAEKFATQDRTLSTEVLQESLALSLRPRQVEAQFKIFVVAGLRVSASRLHPLTAHIVEFFFRMS